jgi:membrane protein DedA with SNARE-associated domain
MHNVSELFISITEVHRLLGYGILFLGMIFEGEFILLAAGVLTHLRILDFWDAFFISLVSVLIGDILWYWLGYAIKNNREKENISRIVSFFKSKKRFRRLPYSLSQNPLRFIFISKFIAGLNHPTLILSGYVKVNFWRFMKIEFFASLIWIFLFLSLGFLFGYAAIAVSKRIDKIVLVVALLILILMVVENQISRLYYKYRKIIEE